ncbi:MAG: NAD(P)/FAD-dependent oxidoreductase [Oscillospiraceae bacterium]|nr:NAD(P)/FAD-dependent oxidoreductase [Oscillospiraceae bacterium]
MKTVIVIGGGASGLMAALTAAREPENRVLILERQQRPGRKLLATGNGRCNLTNTACSLSRYHGEDPAFARPALEAFSCADTLAFFSSLGLLTEEEYGGRVYPLSNSANSVLDVLRLALERMGVELHTASCAVRARREKSGFVVECENERFACDALIVACGGMAGRKLGGVTDGYELLKHFGHERTKLFGALVPLLTAPEYPRALKGIRADAAVALRLDGEILARSEGEVQFTETGVSGPAVFDVSRAASLCGSGTEISFDFFRGRADEELLGMLRARREALPELEASELLCGMLHNRLGRMCVKYAGIGGTQPLKKLSDGDLSRVLSVCRGFALEVRGTAGFDAAQVTAGGVSTAQFDSATLQSRLVPGLYACGEVLDIDGDCGGFNLQWAWSSGALAGRLLS